jgi:hypothetical protein
MVIHLMMLLGRLLRLRGCCRDHSWKWQIVIVIIRRRNRSGDLIVCAYEILIADLEREELSGMDRAQSDFRR